VKAKSHAGECAGAFQARHSLSGRPLANEPILIAAAAHHRYIVLGVLYEAIFTGDDSFDAASAGVGALLALIVSITISV